MEENKTSVKASREDYRRNMKDVIEEVTSTLKGTQDNPTVMLVLGLIITKTLVSMEQALFGKTEGPI